MKAVKINKDVPLDSKGNNENIKFRIIKEDAMKACGFGHTYGKWIYSLGITDTISLNITINDDCSGEIQILDEDFMQPYDFQGMILEKGDKTNATALTVQKRVYSILNDFSFMGIINGWNYGDYI